MFSCAEYIYYIIINCVSKLVKLINSLIKSRMSSNTYFVQGTKNQSTSSAG